MRKREKDREREREKVKPNIIKQGNKWTAKRQITYGLFPISIVLKLYALKIPLHTCKLLRTPRSFSLLGLWLLIYMLKIKLLILKIFIDYFNEQ
jgi:hypothetical protein